MEIEGAETFVAEWLPCGELSIGKGNNFIELSPRQAAELLRFIDERDDPAIQNYHDEKEALAGWEKSKIAKGKVK